MSPASLVLTFLGLSMMAFNIGIFVSIRTPPNAMEYKDFVSIMLTAVTVVLAVLAFSVAVLAIWGYREFMIRAEDTAKSAGESAARKIVDAYLKSDEFLSQVRLSAGVSSKSTSREDDIDRHLAGLDPMNLQPYAGEGAGQ